MSLIVLTAGLEYAPAHVASASQATPSQEDTHHAEDPDLSPTNGTEPSERHREDEEVAGEQIPEPSIEPSENTTNTDAEPTVSPEPSDGKSDREEESAPAERSDSEENSELQQDEENPGAEIVPFSIPEFSANTNTVYTLDRENVTSRQGTTTYATPWIRIRQLTYDLSNTTPIAQENVVMGGAQPLTALRTQGWLSAPTPRAVNSLGVTSDGVFYFTTQQGDDSQDPQGTVDVWRYEMVGMPGTSSPGAVCRNDSDPSGSEDEGWACGPYRVVTNLSLNSAGGGTIVGGAVNPRDGAFYFMYFSGTPSRDSVPDPDDNPYGSGNVRAHLYRYDQNRTAIGQPVAGEVAHFDIRSHENFGTFYNGDIAFDQVGNLLLTVSNTGTREWQVWPPGWVEYPGRTMLATLEYPVFADLPTIQWTDPDTPSVPTLIPSATVGAYGQEERFNPLPGNGVNGLAYTASGNLAVQQGEGSSGGRVAMVDPSTYDLIGSPRTNGTSTGAWVDLATSTSPPVLTVQKYVEGQRIEETDQFTLSGNQQLTAANNEFDPITTTGNAEGLQTEQIGPLPLQAGGNITVREAISANEDDYTSEYRCFIENPDGSEGQTFAEGLGREVTFNYLDDVPGAESGAQQMKCVFTNGPLRPALETSKTSQQEGSASELTEGERLQYQLTFDNSEGTAPAEVNHLDHLSDVLDDADFVDRSIRYGDGEENDYSSAQTTPLGPEDDSIEATEPNADGQLSITGTVPSESTRTVWFEVEVKANLADRPDSETNTGYVLNNYLTQADEDPADTCETDDPNCTSDPVAAWTVTKSSQPPADTWVHSGGNIFYEVEVSKVGAQDSVIDGIRVVDDMSDVMGVARIQPDASDYGPRYQFNVSTYDADGEVVRSFADDALANDQKWDNGQGFQQEQLYPEYTGTPGAGPEEAGWEWTIDVPRFTLNADEVRARIVYVVNVGGAADPDDATEFMRRNSGGVTYPPPVLEPFMNTVRAEADTVDPTRCLVGDTTQQPECSVEHTVSDNYFQIQKNSANRNASGDVLPALGGVNYEIQDANLADGWPENSASAQLCRTNYGAPDFDAIGTYDAAATPDWEEDSATYQSIIDWNNNNLDHPDYPRELCALAYPLADATTGDDTGLWRVRDLPEGNYELIETQAPEGHQLLAEPIPFVLGPASERHQLDLLDTTNPENTLERCSDPNELPSNGTLACVMQTGWTIQLYDAQLQELPITGGSNFIIWFVVAGIVLLVISLVGVWRVRSNRTRGAHAA